MMFPCILVRRPRTRPQPPKTKRPGQPQGVQSHKGEALGLEEKGLLPAVNRIAPKGPTKGVEQQPPEEATRRANNEEEAEDEAPRKEEMNAWRKKPGGGEVVEDVDMVGKGRGAQQRLSRGFQQMSSEKFCRGMQQQGSGVVIDCLSGGYNLQLPQIIIYGYVVTHCRHGLATTGCHRLGG